MIDLAPLLQDPHGWVSARIELYETSGALPPPHCFETTVLVTASPVGVFKLTYRDKRVVSVADLSVEVELPRAEYESLWATLLQSEVLSLGADFVGEHRERAAVRAAICHFELSLGGTHVRFDYLPSHVHSFAFFRHRAAIHAMKSLRSLCASTAP